jgi:hypothetical protein
MKHKCPHTRQIPEVAIIVKTQRQDFKIYGSNISVYLFLSRTSNFSAIWRLSPLPVTGLQI